MSFRGEQKCVAWYPKDKEIFEAILQPDQIIVKPIGNQNLEDKKLDNFNIFKEDNKIITDNEYKIDDKGKEELDEEVTFNEDVQHSEIENLGTINDDM